MKSKPSPAPEPTLSKKKPTRWQAILQLPGVRHLHERHLLLPTLVGLLALVVLIEGALRRGAEDRTPPTSIPSPPATLPLLRPDLEKTPLSYIGDFWRQLAERTTPSLALIGSARVPGLVMREGRALTTLDGGRRVDPTLMLGLDVDLGLALVRLSDGNGHTPFVEITVEELEPGALIAAVTLDSEGHPRIFPGYLLSRGKTRIPGTDLVMLDIAFPAVALAGPAAVVDLDRRLLGVAVYRSEGLRVLSTESARRLIEQLAAGRMSRSIDVGPLDAAVKDALGLRTGVVVERVCQASFAGKPAIRAGDVLLASEKVTFTIVEDFNSWLDRQTSGKQSTLLVWRDGIQARIPVIIPERHCHPLEPPRATLKTLGCAVQRLDAERGLRVAEIHAGGPADQADIKPGDRILSVDGRTPSEKQLRSRLSRALQLKKSVALAIERNNRVRLVGVTPKD